MLVVIGAIVSGLAVTLRAASESWPYRSRLTQKMDPDLEAYDTGSVRRARFGSPRESRFLF